MNDKVDCYPLPPDDDDLDIDAMAQLNLQQIQDSLEQLVAIQRDAQLRNAAEHRVESVIRNLTEQTSRCDGTPQQSVRRWVRDIEIVFVQVGQAHIIRIVTSTVTGTLRDEVERFLELRQQNDQVRQQVPWADIRAHVSDIYLHTNEQQYLRDQLDETCQSVSESDIQFSRRFRSLADGAYPLAGRNDNQQRLMIKAFVRGLRSVTMARKLIKEGAPPHQRWTPR